MIEIHLSDTFRGWLQTLRDLRAKARVIARIRSAQLGNLGDWASVGDDICEMRIHYGPGYRVYYRQRSQQWLLLLNGGDKSTQLRDVLKAKTISRLFDVST